MKKHIQTKTSVSYQNGNCHPTVIACLLGIKPEEVISFENFYFNAQQQENIKKVYKKLYRGDKSKQSDMYHEAMHMWETCHQLFLHSYGYVEKYLYEGKDVLPKYSYKKWLKNNPDTFYTASGKSSRNLYHIVIYRNGKLFHDPHPSQEGLIEGTIYQYSYYEKIR